MIITRLQVEEGFLDGLDLRFRPGLNVLIGPRGAGKTSVVELLRFALEVPGFTKNSDKTAREHALSVLGSGRVTVALAAGDDEVTVTRTAEEGSRRVVGSVGFNHPIVLSQSEIEMVGLDAGGRLRILDSFRTGRASVDDDEASLRSVIRSLTVEMQSIALDIDALEEQLEGHRSTEQELREAVSQEQALSQSLNAARPEQLRLKALGEELATISVRASILERTSKALSSWRQRITDTRSLQPEMERWPGPGLDEDPLDQVRTGLSAAATSLTEAANQVDHQLMRLQAIMGESKQVELQYQEDARGLRQQLEEIEAGSGVVTRRVAELRERAGQLAALKSLLATKRGQLSALQEQRHQALDALDALREDRFLERAAVVEALNKELNPLIDIRIERFGYHPEYSDAIAAALRGSGLHYNLLAPSLAKRLSPRELAEAIERGDESTLAELAEISAERASRVIAYMRSQGVEGILTASLDDAIEMRLLVGKEYQETEQLSTGQRCTVVLPILLGRRPDPLIVDQPEDHLDNAFIVDTLVEAIRKRGQEGQLIFTTHNANIPVLGDAAMVISLGSDGRRGFKRCAAGLDDPQIVDAITSVMEGGREAFERRAAFYRTRLTDGQN